jgi:hypothetical protein
MSEDERVQLKQTTFERVVENWVEFWRWQSKVIEEDFMCNLKLK